MKKPTLQQVADYIKAEGFYDVKPDKFWHYYESIGWTVGKACKPMKQWKSAIVTWTHSTATTRKLHKTTKCACGCGNKPMTMIDGKAYATDRCLKRMKLGPIGMSLAKDLFKKAPDKPKREIWKEMKELTV